MKYRQAHQKFKKKRELVFTLLKNLSKYALPRFT